MCDWWFNVDCSQADQFYALNIEIAEENARRQQEREDAREQGQEERKRKELTAEQIDVIRNGGEVAPPKAKSAQLVLQTTSNRGPIALNNRNTPIAKSNRNTPIAKNNRNTKASQQGQFGGKRSKTSRPKTNNRRPKNSQLSQNTNRFNQSPPKITTQKPSRHTAKLISSTPFPQLKKGQTSFLTIGTTITSLQSATRKPKSKNSKNKQTGTSAWSSRRKQNKSSKRKTALSSSRPKSRSVTFGRRGKNSNLQSKKRPQRQLDDVQPDEKQHIQIELQQQKEHDILIQQKIQQQEHIINQQLEEEQKEMGEKKRLEQFEQQLQKRIDQQQMEEQKYLADQQRMEEQKYLAEQQKEKSQKLEEQRQQLLQQLNQQVQQQIKKTLDKELNQRGQFTVERIKSHQVQHVREPKEMKKSLIEVSGPTPSPNHGVPLKGRRKKIRRRRPKTSSDTPVHQNKGVNVPFTAFGNSQSRFGIGG